MDARSAPAVAEQLDVVPELALEVTLELFAIGDTDAKGKKRGLSVDEPGLKRC